MKHLLFGLIFALAVWTLSSCAHTQPSSSTATAHQERSHDLESGHSPGSIVPPEETNR